MFRRRRAEVGDGSGVEPGDDAESAEADVRAHGPWDASEITVEEDDDSRIDLGSLLVPARPDVEVQLQVDEASGTVLAVILAGAEGAAELRAFAAPRHGDIWDDTRTALAGEVVQMGGTASEIEGSYGPALDVLLTVELPDGGHAQHPSRVVGISGPRWLLRATLFGRAALAHDEDGDVEQAIREVVVVRGSDPIPPGDPLPLTMPPGARQGP